MLRGCVYRYVYNYSWFYSRFVNEILDHVITTFKEFEIIGFIKFLFSTLHVKFRNVSSKELREILSRVFKLRGLHIYL